MARHLSLLLILANLAVGPVGHAEYRVFLLKIEKAAAPAAPGQKPVPGEARYVQSNLDPEQYLGYYHLESDEVKITYVDTWRCQGRTDNRPYCENPRHPASDPSQGPESSSAGAPPANP